jgi:histidinol-phosphate aminotransferase
MEPYTPIVPFEVLSARLGRPPDQIVKLDANENPYGPSPKALVALAEGKFFHIYPDPESNQLREALVPVTGIPKEYLLAGAGADELIDLVARAIIAPGDSLINCPPSFGMYPFTAHVNSAHLINVPRRADFSLDVDSIIAAASQSPTPKLIYLCSPNNPDGSTISDTDLRRILELPLLVVLDEAYVEFQVSSAPHPVYHSPFSPTQHSALSTQHSLAPASRISWVLEHNNLVVLRTFSKLAGLAGLRVGYGAFPLWLIEQLWKIKQPYNVNVAATVAALASLDDAEWLHEKTDLLVTERERLAAALHTIPYLIPYPSQANFILCRVVGQDALELKLALEREGILVRYFAKPGLENCIRVSVARPQDTERLMKHLNSL